MNNAKPKKNEGIPLYASKVAAGFPLPGDDLVERALDLNTLLIENPTATFFVRAEGDSMIGAGINSGDILIVDRSKAVSNGSIVVAALHGELIVKRVQKKGQKTFLVYENEAYAPLHVEGNDDCFVWGVVTSAITQF